MTAKKTTATPEDPEPQDPAPAPKEVQDGPEAPDAAPDETQPEPDPYDDYNDAEAFPAVLILATGEKVGSASVQSTQHWSRELECDVPVVGALAR